MKKIVIVILGVILISTLIYIKIFDGLGYEYYLTDIGMPYKIVTHKQSVIIEPDVIDIDYNSEFIVALRRMEKSSSDFSEEEMAFYNMGLRKQYWIINKKKHKYYHTYNYQKFLEKLIEFNIESKLKIDTTLELLHL